MDRAKALRKLSFYTKLPKGLRPATTNNTLLVLPYSLLIFVFEQMRLKAVLARRPASS